MIMSLHSGLAVAGNYSVGWWMVQKIYRENGNSVNRVAFDIQDGSGAMVLTDVVQGIALLGPGGSIPLDPHDFDTPDLLLGSIDTSSGQWSYDSAFSPSNYHIATFSADLVEGNYTLVITDTDGEAVANDNPTKYFNGVVELPEISSKTFRGYTDAGGNFFWQWDPPDDTAVWSQSLDVSIRCYLIIYNGDNHIGDVYVTVPATLGGMYVPRNVMDLVWPRGDKFYVQLHLRTNDNNNRYYTNPVSLNVLKKERSSKTVVIPLL
jgi:hypothetical protein